MEFFRYNENMPTYEYFCEANQVTIEVIHSMKESLGTWGELCARKGIDPGTTPPETPIKKLISAPNINTPLTNSALKNMGFTKLVKRDKGVYENVTAHDREKRFMVSGDATSLPNIKKKIQD